MNHGDLEQEGTSGLKHCHKQPHSSSTARTLRDKRDGREFEVRSSRFSELRTLNFELYSAPVIHFTHPDITTLGTPTRLFEEEGALRKGLVAAVGDLLAMRL
jgi:hypothetical protein